MIADRLINWPRYFTGEPWKTAFQFLESLTPESEVQHLIPIRGEDLFARIMTYPTRPPEEGMLEAHNEYIDIQMSLTGTEAIDWFSRGPLETRNPYDAEKDVIFFHRPAHAGARIINSPGIFSVYYQDDAHMAQMMAWDAREDVKKVVVKVRASLLGN